MYGCTTGTQKALLGLRFRICRVSYYSILGVCKVGKKRAEQIRMETCDPRISGWASGGPYGWSYKRSDLR